MERNVIRPVPINFALLLLPSIRWGNKMQYNTGWTCLCKNPYAPRTWVKTTYGASPEFEQKGDSFLSRGMATLKLRAPHKTLWTKKRKKIRRENVSREIVIIVEKIYLFNDDKDLRNRTAFIFKVKNCFDTRKLFKQNTYVGNHNLWNSKFPSSFSIFHIINYFGKKRAFDARYLLIWSQKTMTNSDAYFSIDVPFPIPRLIYMAIN